jgi:hypothetical protein
VSPLTAKSADIAVGIGRSSVNRVLAEPTKNLTEPVPIDDETQAARKARLNADPRFVEVKSG